MQQQAYNSLQYVAGEATLQSKTAAGTYNGLKQQLLIASGKADFKNTSKHSRLLIIAAVRADVFIAVAGKAESYTEQRASLTMSITTAAAIDSNTW